MCVNERMQFVPWCARAPRLSQSEECNCGSVRVGARCVGDASGAEYKFPYELVAIKVQEKVGPVAFRLAPCATFGHALLCCFGARTARCECFSKCPLLMLATTRFLRKLSSRHCAESLTSSACMSVGMTGRYVMLVVLL